MHADPVQFALLGGAMLEQAVEDVRLYLQNPTTSAVNKNRINAKHEAARRKHRAMTAAHWLSSQACKDLCAQLTDLGHPPPLKRWWQELQALKQTSPQAA